MSYSPTRAADNQRSTFRLNDCRDTA